MTWEAYAGGEDSSTFLPTRYCRDRQTMSREKSELAKVDF